MASSARPFLPILACILLLVQCTDNEVRKIPAVMVFGDSSVDNNCYPTPLKSNFDPYGRDFIGGKPTGRFSNGRVDPDSEAFGHKPLVPANYLDPSFTIADFATGVNSAGTGFDNATSQVPNVIPLWKEIEYYKEYQQRLREHLGTEKADYILTEAQYFLTELYNLGVRKISFTPLTPLERIWNFFRGSECNEEYNSLAMDFNSKLRGLGLYLKENLLGMKLHFSDLYSIVLQMIQKPKTFGFEVSAQACCGMGQFEMSYLCNRQSFYL